MKGKAPGQYHCDGISLPEFFEMFPDDAAAEQWFIESRWPGGVRCPACNSDNIQHRATRKPQPFRCRSCRNDFSVKTGTVMQSSNLQMQAWALAVYLLTTGIKGTASMKLHRDLRVTQKTAWHLAHRIRESWDDQAGAQYFDGPVELDEAYFGGKEGNKHASKRQRQGRGTVGKTAVAGAKDRETNQISAAVVPETTKRELQAFAFDRIAEEADVFTDETGAYHGMPNRTSVNHGVGEFVRGQASTNGLESFWSMMKRGYYGTYHRMSPAHLQRYVNEFAGRHNQRPYDTEVQMRMVVQGMERKRLRYKDLKVGRGVSSRRAT